MSNLPDFMIIGVPRSGTSSLFVNLATHPKIQRPLTKPLWYSKAETGLENKELDFFSRPSRYKKGLRLYSSMFPLRKPGHLTFEASTYYCYYPERIKQAMPHIKAILILRNPVERACSQFWGKYHKSYRNEPIEMLGKPEEKLHSAVKGGIYIAIVKNWHRHFPKENLLILKSEDWFLNPHDTLKQVYRFLGMGEPYIYPDEILRADPWEANKEKHGKPKIPESIREELHIFYRPHNKQLSEYLGKDFGWDR